MVSVPIAYLHKFAGGVALNNICMNQICHLCLSMDGENKLVPLLVRLTPLSLANDRERFPIGVWDSFMIPSSSRMLMFNVLLSFIKKVESEGGWMREKWSHQDEWTKEEIKQ